MNIEKSRSLKLVKDEIGQLNHFLITILVGLNAIIEHNIKKSQDFFTSWNPKNKMFSVNRSRMFAIKSTLTWIVDNIDMYLRTINEEPKMLQGKTILSSMFNNGQSVYLNFIAMTEHFKTEDMSVDEALVDLAICWRNRLVHYKADNDIRKISYKVFSMNRESIKQNYCDLDIVEMLKRFENKEVPSFKEITSMVRACIRYLEALDTTIISKLDKVEYSQKVIYYYIKNNENLKNVFSKDVITKKRKLRNILKQNSFNEKENVELDNYIDLLCSKNYIEFLKEFEEERI